MKRVVSLFVLVLAALSAGCRSDIAELKFATSVVAERVDYNTGSRIKPVYREGVIALLTEAGIDPDTVRISYDKDDYSGRTMVLNMPLFAGLSAAQENALRDALESIIKARDDDFYLNLTLRPEQIRSDAEDYREDVKTLATEYRTQLSIDDAIIGLSYSLGDMYAAALKGSRESEGEAFCSVAVNMSPALPFTDVDVIYRPAEAIGESTASADNTADKASPIPQGIVLVRRPESSHSRYNIPVDITVTLGDTTPAMQTKLDNKEVLLSTTFINSESVALYRKEIGAVEFQLGTMGTVQHQSRQMNYFSMQNLKEKCRFMAAERMGRPFSFTMGESIDRLESVTVF